MDILGRGRRRRINFMKLTSFFALLLIICFLGEAYAEVHLSVTPYYSVSEEEIIGGITVCSEGNVMMFSRFLREKGRSRLLILSPESKLLEEQFLEFDKPNFLTEINGKKLIGFVQGSETILRFLDDSHEWIFPEEIPWLNTHKFDDSTYLVKIHGNPPDFYIQKIMEDGSPVHTTDSKVMIGEYILPQYLFSDGKDLYYLKNSLKKKGIYKLMMENESPVWELFLKGNFFQAIAISNDVHKLLFLTPSKILVQNELQVRSLLDCNILERLKFIHDAMGLSAASNREYALLVISAKATLNSGELIVFDKESKIILRDKESWKKGYSIRGYNPVNDSFIVQNGFNKIELIKIIE